MEKIVIIGCESLYFFPEGAPLWTGSLNPRPFPTISQVGPNSFLFLSCNHTAIILTSGIWPLFLIMLLFWKAIYKLTQCSFILIFVGELQIHKLINQIMLPNQSLRRNVIALFYNFRVFLKQWERNLKFCSKMLEKLFLKLTSLNHSTR